MAGFFAAAFFFVTGLAATFFLAAGFFVVGFFATDFFATDFFAAGFFAAGFFAAGFLAAGFVAFAWVVFFAALGFALAAVFFLVVVVLVVGFLAAMGCSFVPRLASGGILEETALESQRASRSMGLYIVNNRIALYIMAGGKSSRFGSDKARALHQGKPLLSHVAEALQTAASGTTVVAQEASQYEDLGFSTIPDKQPHLGPMGGLYTALLDHQARCQEAPEESGWCAVVSCDVVGLQVTWLDALLAHRDSPYKAIAYGTDPWDPLFALYHVDLLPELETRLAAGKGSLWRMLDAVGALALPHPENWGEAQAVNTREALVGLEK